MRLVDHLECVLILDDARFRPGTRRFEAILGSLAARGLFSAALVPELHAAILRRDELGPTGIGEGVAIPHAWHPGLDRMCGPGHLPPGIGLSQSRWRARAYRPPGPDPPSPASEPAKQEIFDQWLRHLREPAFRAALRWPPLRTSFRMRSGGQIDTRLR